MYLYIFEDGTLCQHAEPPTDEDTIYIEDGILEVIESTGEFVDVPKGVRVENDTTDPFTLDWESAKKLMEIGGWAYAE